MLSNLTKTMMMGGKIAALTALMGTTALAQSATVVDTNDGNPAVVPGAAADAESSVGTVGESAYPMVVQTENDQVVAETLIAQGFTDVHILREGPMLTVTAQRDGQPIELVYSVANGSLVSVNGEELRDAPEAASSNDTVPADQMTAPDETDDGDMDGDDGATDDGSDDGMTGDDGMSDGTGSDDGGSDDGMSDGGSDDGADGSDSGSDSDGGSDGGESDGGDSDGGESDGGDGTNG